MPYKRYFGETSFAERLQAFKHQLGITNEDIAELLDTYNDQVVRWLRSENTPHILTQEGALARLEKAWRHKG